MIEKIRSWMKSDPLLTVMTGALCFLAAAYFLFFRPIGGDSQEEPAAIQEFRRAEKIFQEKLSEEEALKKFLKEHPVLAGVFNVASLGLVAAFAAGLWINYLFFTRPQFRIDLQNGGPPDTVNWTWKMLIRVLVIWIGVSLILSMIFTVLSQIFLTFNWNFAALLHTSIMDVLMVILIAGTLLKCGGHWRDMGFRLKGTEILNEIKIGLLGYAAVIPVFIGVLITIVTIAKMFAYEPPAHPLVGILLEEDKKAPGLIIYSVFIAAVLGPIVEEIFFRGFCYPIIRKKWGRGFALVLTASFFAFIHQNQFAFWPIFILGAALAYLYEKRNNVVAPITLHIVHNSIFMGYFFLAKNLITASGAAG